MRASAGWCAENDMGGILTASEGRTELEEITACVEAIFGIVDESYNPS